MTDFLNIMSNKLNKCALLCLKLWSYDRIWISS